MAPHAEAVRVSCTPTPLHHPRPLEDLVAIRPQRGKLQDGFLRINFGKKLAKYVQKGVAVGLALDFSENLLGNYGKN
jgi:hypothetical protein